MIYLAVESREQGLIDSLKVVAALRSGLSKTGFQCGECVKLLSCNKVAQDEFCLEWEFITSPDRSCGSQNSDP